MAFPAVQTTSSGANTGLPSSHTVNLPSGIVSGDKLIVCFCIASDAPGLTWPGGWTPKASDTSTGGNFLEIRERTADGTEGSSITITSTVNFNSAYVCYRINGDSGATLQIAIQIDNTADTAADVPSLSPSWGAKDTLWIEVSSLERGGVTLGPYSTNYGNDFTANTGGAGSDVVIGTARRENNAATESPNAITISGAGARDVTALMAIEPQAGNQLWWW